MSEKDSQNRHQGQDYSSGSSSESDTTSNVYEQAIATVLETSDEEVEIMGGSDAEGTGPGHAFGSARVEHQSSVLGRVDPNVEEEDDGGELPVHLRNLLRGLGYNMRIGPGLTPFVPDPQAPHIEEVILL